MWNNPDGWGGRRVWDGGTHEHPWPIHTDVWQKPPQYCKVIILQLKQLTLKRGGKKVLNERSQSQSTTY